MQGLGTDGSVLDDTYIVHVTPVREAFLCFARPTALAAASSRLEFTDMTRGLVLSCNMIETPWLVNGGHGASLRR